MTKRRKTKRRPPPTVSGPVMPAKYRERYAEHGGSSGDDLAVRLKKQVATADGSIDLAKLREIAEANGVWDARYANLNPGMQRMDVANRLRALARHGAKLKWAAVLLVLVFAAGDRVTAQPLTTFRNDKGQITGQATTRGNTTTFSNDRGQQTGRAERGRDGTTTFYDAMGRQVGTARTRR
jgi:hypothetical protein